MGYLPKHIFPFMLHQLVPKSLHTWESTRYAVKPLSLLEANTSNFITRVFRINTYFQNSSPTYANL